MLKKGGKKLRLVHSQEPQHEVTLAHSGVLLSTEALMAQFSGWASDVTVPFIDVVPIKGLVSKYMNSDRMYEMIPENTGIRHFVWEHFQNPNRVVQQMKYCGGTFSGPKTPLCAAEIMVVGHRCTYDGRLPETDHVGVIKQWLACNNVSEVQMSLETIGVCRVFIKDFAQPARPLNNLLGKDVAFEWTKDHDWAMQDLKNALEDAVPLGNID